jgi:hypothetical protein
MSDVCIVMLCLDFIVSVMLCSDFIVLTLGCSVCFMVYLMLLVLCYMVYEGNSKDTH